MAESLALITSVDEGLRRGLQQNAQDTSALKHAGTYETFEEDDAAEAQTQSGRDEAIGCSPVAIFRHLGAMLTGKEKEESLPLTEKRKMSTPACYLQAFRYLPLAVHHLAVGTARKAKKAGLWVVVGLQNYAEHGGYAYPIHTHANPATSQAAFWVSVL